MVKQKSDPKGLLVLISIKFLLFFNYATSEQVRRAENDYHLDFRVDI
uniref:Uncharacterized protein n=1 Tax=Rhizophora mucronata TaxID=61149 RepID=A0A2P2N4B5_RHIMU